MLLLVIDASCQSTICIYKGPFTPAFLIYAYANVCVMCAHIFNVINQFTNMLQTTNCTTINRLLLLMSLSMSMSIQIQYRILQWIWMTSLKTRFRFSKNNFHISNIIITQWNHDKTYHLSPKISVIKCNSYRLIFDASRHV